MTLPTLVHSQDATEFTLASDALQAALQWEAAQETFQQYDVRAVFIGGERELSGYHVRVLDMDGFALGYLKEAA